MLIDWGHREPTAWQKRHAQRYVGLDEMLFEVTATVDGSRQRFLVGAVDATDAQTQVTTWIDDRYFGDFDRKYSTRQVLSAELEE